MKRYNVQASRWDDGREQLPQFDIMASSIEEACKMALTIIGAEIAHVDVSGAVTDGDKVWDLVTGKVL